MSMTSLMVVVTTICADRAKLPPASFFVVNGHNFLAGGRHRFEAHLRKGIKHIEADIYEGSFDDAWLFSRGDNNHGKPLNNAEKSRAAKEMLEKVPAWSDSAIAGHIGVSQPFVRSIRKDSGYNGYNLTETRIGRDGKNYPASTAPKSSPDPNETDSSKMV